MPIESEGAKQAEIRIIFKYTKYGRKETKNNWKVLVDSNWKQYFTILRHFSMLEQKSTAFLKPEALEFPVTTRMPNSS